MVTLATLSSFNIYAQDNMFLIAIVDTHTNYPVQIKKYRFDTSGLIYSIQNGNTPWRMSSDKFNTAICSWDTYSLVILVNAVQATQILLT